MRKVAILVLACLVSFAGISAVSYAQEEEEMQDYAMEETEGPSDEEMRGPAGRGMMHGMMDKSRMMMKSMMMKKSMVATEDGGVIILSGNKLIKYDGDLNLVKEVTVKQEEGDMSGMHKGFRGRGMKMQKEGVCPCCGRPMPEKGKP